MTSERGELQLEGIQARTEQQQAGVQDVGRGGQELPRQVCRTTTQVDNRNHGHEGAKLLVVLGGTTRWSSRNTSAWPTPKPRTGGTALQGPWLAILSDRSCVLAAGSLTPVAAPGPPGPG